MPRIPLLSADSDLTPEQRRVVENILGRRGGRIPGPFRFTLHHPELTELLHPIGELLRLNSLFPLRLSEFAILIAGRAMDCDYVFNAHTPFALKGGLKQEIVDAVARNERPVSLAPDEEAIYNFCSELLEDHAVSDKSYARALELFGVKGVVELAGLVGYYSMVALTLLAHQMPLPEGAKPPLAKRRQA